MSSQGEDETRLQYLRRCSDCLQKQTRRYNRRRRRCRQQSHQSEQPQASGAYMLSCALLAFALMSASCAPCALVFCSVTCLARHLLRMRIPWRLTSWPLRCHGPGCTLPLSLRQAIRYIIQVSTACFSDGFTTNHSSLPGPKSGGGSRSTNALHFIVLILFSCVCGTSGVRVWGNAVQQPHEAVTSAQQHIPQSKPQRIRSRDPRVLSLLLLSTRIREHSNVPSNTDTLAIIKVPCTHLPPSIVNTSPTRNRRRLAGPVWHRQCQACTSCSGTPVASPPLGWQSSSSGYTDQAPDVCLITESHWSSSCEYTQDSYHVINSGNGSWHGGVFVLIRKT